ncbi:MAG: ABC transporter ATP-binding protein [Spirochaetes bacterium]|nr:ABC transporter ATP-binding protein [Spirochaetota bacterium]
MFLVLENVVKRFPPRGGAAEVTAVNGVSLSIEKGELVTLLGPSGCGKTTTLRLIGGFEVLTSGRILLDGVGIDNLPPHKRGMSMVFQSYAIFPHLNVFENIAYGLHVQKIPEPEVKRRVRKVLELVNLLGYENRAPNQLSGGQQQRVALARALVMEPKVLLLDEPLSNLDAKLREQMRTEIRRIQQELQITSVYVTHDQIEAMTLSDHIVVMNQGIIEQIGTPEEIYRHPNSQFVANFIGRANFIPAKAKSVQGREAVVECYGKEFQVSCKKGITAGTKGVLVLRPEMLWISDREGVFKGVIKRSVYLGNAIEYEVAVDGASLIVMETNPKRMKLYARGTSVTLDAYMDLAHFLLA